MKVLVCKTSSSVYTNLEESSAYGDSRDWRSVVESLRDAGYEVCLAGRIRGDNMPGVHLIDWGPIKGSNLFYSDEGQVRECCETFTEKIREWAPEVTVNLIGATPTVSCPWNPTQTVPYDFGVKYVLPYLFMLNETGLPRITIVNDPRSYTRDKEMTFWKGQVPCAVLSQEQLSFPKRMYGNLGTIHAKYAKCQNWCTYGIEPKPADNDKEIDVGVLAHSHLHDARLNKNRDAVWSWILWQVLNDPDLSIRVHGRHWEQFSNYDVRPEAFAGELNPSLIFDFLNKCVCGPMIPVSHGFVTAKFRQYALAGCVPLPYGRGSEYMTYDVHAWQTPLDSGMRFVAGEELQCLATSLKNNVAQRQEMIEHALAATVPDFSLLFQCVEYFAEAHRCLGPFAHMGAVDFEKFGGYEYDGLL